jgi:hypothetical protein
MFDIWPPKNTATESERRICEAEERVSRPIALIERLTEAGCAETAHKAGELLCLLQDSLGLMRHHVAAATNNLLQ